MCKILRQVVLVGLAVVIVAGSLTGCIQDATCSSAGHSRMNAAIVELLMTSPGQVDYVSTADCESGSPLSGTLTLQISWSELMSRLSDRCRAAADSATCRLGDSEFTVILLSEPDADVGVVIQEVE